MNDQPDLLLNEGGNRNNFISIRLIGSNSSRDAFGSLVSVRTGGLTQVAEARSGSTFMSNSDPRLHFGLGQASVVEEISVSWLGGTSQTFRNVPANQFLVVKEGTGVVKEPPFGN